VCVINQTGVWTVVTKNQLQCTVFQILTNVRAALAQRYWSLEFNGGVCLQLQSIGCFGNGFHAVFYPSVNAFRF